ncbi:MAG: amino-acid N-acetyltransferase [Bifidobacteriaceae bacterium]|nr:amino-acid N-acetyltransferase [Bifidobacteriaceae bacterium]
MSQPKPVPGPEPPAFTVRPAVAGDIRAIRALAAPYVEQGRLVRKALVSYYESLPDFRVAVTPDGVLVACGAIHVMWDDLGEVRTLAALPEWQHRGVGHAVLEALIERARQLGLRRLFCLTFEVDFFARHGFEPIEGIPIEPWVYAELLHSKDDGVAEFLDLARVKPNTLGNTRMLLHL